MGCCVCLYFTCGLLCLVVWFSGFGFGALGWLWGLGFGLISFLVGNTSRFCCWVGILLFRWLGGLIGCRLMLGWADWLLRAVLLCCFDDC